MRYFALLAALILAITAWFSLRATAPSHPSETAQTENPAAVATTAAFLIYTNNVKRSFTASMYHHKSNDVYLTAQNPQLVHVTVQSITWGEFFRTLPMRLTAQCLTTGTKETYCTQPSGMKLQFFLNGQETPAVLRLAIANNDRLLVTYGLTTELDLAHQIQSVPYPIVLDTPTPNVEQ